MTTLNIKEDKHPYYALSGIKIKQKSQAYIESNNKLYPIKTKPEDYLDQLETYLDQFENINKALVYIKRKYAKKNNKNIPEPLKSKLQLLRQSYEETT